MYMFKMFKYKEKKIIHRTIIGNYEGEQALLKRKTINSQRWKMSGKNKHNTQNESQDIPINCTKLKRILRELYVNKLGNLDEIDKSLQTRN